MKKNFSLTPFIGPGLPAFSKYPLNAIDHLYYNECDTADCYATKGVQLLELTLPSGKRIQIANTHMQSGSRYSHIRKVQLEQIKKLLEKNKKSSIPQLLVGDLNIDSHIGNEFNGTLATLQMNPIKQLMQETPPATDETPEDAPVMERIKDFFSAGFTVTCLKEGNDAHPKLVDHVLYFENDQHLVFKNDQIIFPEFNLKGKTCPLSDHRPRVVTLEI